ncbi:flagellar basal body rod protein FlgC [Wenzhouxiangella limi]|uniref:Flagellar basal-body rod protein FlgC n=1 Tax=Wenzhouxiangella limi TaxID=2707351 RepID=A0A845VIU7_9GAMM|nr:flagellar basal body rod protein FlgC [Wenzhouxiangella limi]NDY97099.1 flagellar basal body rod protein FlgC [Wenzhouxiangella limi]
MSLFKVFDIAGSGMSAQSVRLNTTASNLANANSVSTTEEGAYRSRQPLFQAALDRAAGGNDATVGVRVLGIMESSAEPQRLFEPGNPQADEEGYVYKSNVNIAEEMANMISASRSFQNNIEVLNTSKDLMMRTLNLGR